MIAAAWTELEKQIRLIKVIRVKEGQDARKLHAAWVQGEKDARLIQVV